MTPRQNGFSLMESLIAVVVLSTGLLGLARLQAGLWQSAGQLHAQSEAQVLCVSNLEHGLHAAPASDTAQQPRRSSSGSGYTVFESRLLSERQGLLTELHSAVHWQHTDGLSTLRLMTASYRPDAGDVRWLLGHNR